MSDTPPVSSAARSPGDRLRQRREAAGLSRDELALGLETVPIALSARARADLIGLAEIDCLALTDDDVDRLGELIDRLAAAFGVEAQALPALPADAAA